MADDSDGKTELAAARARIKELNEESASHRVLAKDLRAELDSALASHKAELSAYTEKLTAAEKAAADAGERVSQATRDAALKLAAKDAGIVDLDGLKLLDTSAVKVGDDGAVAIPKDFFDKARESKPYLFAKTGAQTGTTASTAKAPATTATTPKSARDMTPAEYAAAKSALGL